MLEEQQDVVCDRTTDARSRDGALELERARVRHEPEVRDEERCERRRIHAIIRGGDAGDRRLRH